MQLTYVVSELKTGLRRNLSMTVAVVVTMFVSLTLVGLGILLNAQANKAEEFWGDRLQITVFMCTDNSPGAGCIDGQATEAQKRQVEEVLSGHPEVEKFHFETSQQAYDKWRDVYSADDESQQQVVEAIKPSDLAESYWITLKDPREFQEVKTEVSELPGVGSVRDLRQVLEPIYFWINAFKWGAVVIAGFLLFAAIGVFLYVVVYRLLRPNSNLVAWVDWGDGAWAIGIVAVVGLALTLIPTLLLTRKYLKV
jgi:cell division transport system permease protein